MTSDQDLATSTSRYREVQHFHPIFNVLVVGLAAMALWCLISDLAFDRPLGTSPAHPGVLVGVLVFFVALYLLLFRLVVRVDGESVRVEFGYLGLVKFRWTADQIRSCQPMKYSFWDFGGWGIRYGMDGVWCYSARGNEAVRIETGKRGAAIGTQRPKELAAAIRQLIGQ